MVKIHFKKGDESQFLLETTVTGSIEDLIKDVSVIYNGRLKVGRICTDMEFLADHGTILPVNMQGLTEDQITDLKLKDEWGEKCEPSGGYHENPDKLGRRNGKAPNEKMAEVLKRTLKEAKDLVDKKNVTSDICVTQSKIKEALDMLRGAVMIVYPMELPPHDPIRLEFEDQEDLAGTQAALDVIEEANMSLWWAGKEFQRDKTLKDFIGKNEKTKIVAKIQKRGQGAPGREPVVSEVEQKNMMAYYYRKQEEMKKLDASEDDSHLDSAWADSSSLKRQFQGLNNIKWGGPR